MKATNFYTQNGWAGSNYDSKLSTKEIAAKVRSYAKKNFPDFKFSVRYEWSMYTDSMYIELKEGTCVPFLEGSKSAERGYISTMETVKGWEKELTPETFAVLDAVTTYANSFRYDDSDGMQDYFDTNFYLSIKVSDEYKVIEPNEKKTPKKEKKGTDNVVEGLEIVDYSEKAIAVFGDTKAIKEQLKELGGRFNRSLNYNGEKSAGWIFSKKQANKVKELITPIELSEIVSNTDISQKKRGKSLQDIIDQTRRINGYAGRNWYWSSKREKLINKIYSDYVTNIQKLGAFSEPEKKFIREEYAGIIPTELPVLSEKIYIPELTEEKVQRGSNEKYPLEKIYFTETDNLNGICYYDIEGAGIIINAKVRADIQPGDVFNVYTEEERKYAVTYDGVSLNRSLYSALPGVIEFDNKIKAGTLSISSHYKPMIENIEVYEKKVKGKRYTVKDKPLQSGVYAVTDTLDNCYIDYYRTKEEAEKEAERLNEHVNENGQLKRAI